MLVYFVWAGLEFTVWSRLAPDSQQSCLSLPNTKITRHEPCFPSSPLGFLTDILNDRGSVF